MKTIKIFYLGSALLVLSTHVIAQEVPTAATPKFYVCTLKGGLKQFQDRPCADGQEQITDAELKAQRDQQATRAKQETASPWLETVAEIVLGGVASANARKSSSISEKPAESSHAAEDGSGKSSTNGYQPITSSASMPPGNSYSSPSIAASSVQKPDKNHCFITVPSNDAVTIRNTCGTPLEVNFCYAKLGQDSWDNYSCNGRIGRSPGAMTTVSGTYAFPYSKGATVMWLACEKNTGAMLTGFSGGVAQGYCR